MANRAISKNSRRSPTTQWGMLARDLRRAIELREYLVGEQLPTEMELAAQYGVSRMTVREALASLTEDGYIDRLHGHGTFVAEGREVMQHDLSQTQPWKDRAKSTGLEAGSQQLDAAEHLAPPRSVLFDLGVEAQAVSDRYYKRLQLFGGKPLGVSESWLGAEVAAELPNGPLIHDSLSRTLEDRLGIIPARVDAYMHAETATQRVADLLQCHSDEPLVVVNELASASDGTVISISRTRWLGHRVRFHQQLSSHLSALPQ